MAAFRARTRGIAFGGDYNPEQWDPSVWREDMALMRRAGVTLVTLGVFAWSTLEPEPDRFEFDWLDEVFGLLHENGILVDLATPTMAPPVWLSHEHPETLPVQEDGTVFGFGNRLHYDPAAPLYRERSAIIADRLAARYSAHPALAMWHVSNEYGRTAYTDATAAAFRRWLRERYGSLDALNDAWYTRFWSQTYTDWEQVDPPQLPRSWSNPGRRLDFRRFSSELLLDCFRSERDVVRSYRDDLPILTNFMRFYKPADYWRWAPEEDAVALDIYPDPADPGARVSASFQFDLMRSLKKRPWVLMEQAASGVSQWKRNAVKRPGRMRLGTYQAIARGADTALFFQWRASRGGHERFHSAMLPHSGTASRTWREVEALGRELPAIAETAGGTSTARVAVLFDWEGWWGLEDSHGLPRNDFDYPGLVTEHYRPLLEAQHAVDVVGYGSELDGYALVVIPNAYLVTDAFAERLTAFVRGGGAVLCSFFSGVADETSRVRQPAYPGAFRELLGGHVDEFWPALDGEEFGVRFSDGSGMRASWWQDSLTVDTAEVLAVYEDGALAGRPALTRNRLGAGTFTSIGTRLSGDGLARVVRGELDRLGLRPLVDGAPATVEAAERVTDTGRYLFLLNHDDGHPVTVAVPAGVDLLTGRRAGPTIAIEECGVAVLRLDDPDREGTPS